MMKTTFIDNIRKKKEDLPGDELQEIATEGDQLSAIEDSRLNQSSMIVLNN